MGQIPVTEEETPGGGGPAGPYETGDLMKRGVGGVWGEVGGVWGCGGGRRRRPGQSARRRRKILGFGGLQMRLPMSENAHLDVPKWKNNGAAGGATNSLCEEYP